MNILNRIRTLLKALRITDEDLRRAGVDTRYAAERDKLATTYEAEYAIAEYAIAVSEAIRYRRRAKDAEQALEAATEALRKIECMTAGMELDPNAKLEAIQELALEAWREATK